MSIEIGDIGFIADPDGGDGEVHVEVLAWGRPDEALEIKTPNGTARVPSMWVRYIDVDGGERKGRVARQQGYFRRDQDY